jgi:hypothetical protein
MACEKCHPFAVSMKIRAVAQWLPAETNCGKNTSHDDVLLPQSRVRRIAAAMRIAG